MKRSGLRAALLGGLAVTALTLHSAPAAAQLSEPCAARCGVVLFASSYAVGTGVLVAWARHNGGLGSTRTGALIWAGGFAATFATGLALHGNGARQERAVYGSGLGTVAGALAGYAVGSVAAPDDEPRRWAATLVGAGVGALAGGLYGALTHDDRGPISVPLMSLSVR